MIFSPNIPAFDGIIENVNVTFQALRNVSRAAEMWLNVSPQIHNALNTMNATNILEVIQSLNISLPFLSNLTAEDLANQMEMYCIESLFGFKTKFEIFHLQDQFDCLSTGYFGYNCRYLHRRTLLQITRYRMSVSIFLLIFSATNSTN